MEEVEAVFMEFCRFGDKNNAGAMDSAKFAKLARECKLLDSTVTRTDVDLIFTRVKEKTERRITFPQFKNALRELAKLRSPSEDPEKAFDAVCATIVKNGHAHTSGATVAKADGIYSKLTDSSLYTGAHKQRFDSSGSGRGLDGRDSVSKGRTSGADLAKELKDRPERTHSGIKKKSGSSQKLPEVTSASSLAEVFQQFCSFGDKTNTTHMDSAKFVKLAKQCKIVDGKAVTTTDCDLVFSKVKDKGERRIQYNGFEAGLRELAKKRFRDQSADEAFERTKSLVLSNGGSCHSSGTATATGSGIFDKLTDSSQYTGAHKERFDEDGKGRGMAGRDSVSKGGGTSSESVAKFPTRTHS